MISGMKCQNCGKGIMYGHNVSHSKRRTRRIFKPNLHTVRVSVNGVMKRMKLCSKCLRLLKGKSTKQLKIQNSPASTSEAGRAKVKSEIQKLESKELIQSALSV